MNRRRSDSADLSPVRISIFVIAALLLGGLVQIQFPSKANASGVSVTAPSQPTFSLNTSGQDPGDFVIAGFTDSDNLLVSIGFVDPPSGTSFSLPTTTGLTASSGYDFTGGKTQISFTGSQTNANTALAAMTVATGSSTGDITIRVTASLSVATVFYNPINNHYYEYFSTSVYAWNSSDTSTSAIHLSETKSRYGVTGYLATITNAQEQKFIYENFSYDNIWVGATDDYQVLNSRCGSTDGWSNFANQAASEGKWYWISGPSDEKCKQFWQGASSSGLWVNSSSGATQARVSGNVSTSRYENWCTGNSSPYTLTAGRSMSEPNNWGGNEQFALEKWSGATCWNDWGIQASGQQAYLVEYSGDFNDPATFATATLTARVSNAPRNVTAARATPALSGELVVSWQAPIGVTPTSYTATSSPLGRTCTTTNLTCTVDGLANGTLYTFTVVATYADASTATSLASTAVSPASTPVSISYDSQGGGSISSGSSIVGGSISSSPGSPTRQYFSFLGWFTAASGGTAITFPYTHGQTSNFTLYAQWSDTRRTQSISLAGDTLDRGATTTLSASGFSGTGEVTYSLASGDCTLRGAVLSVNGGSGTCVVNASIAADSTYQGASTSATFTLRTRQSQSITFASLTNTTVNGATQSVIATSSSGLSVSLATTTPSICSLSSGTVRPLSRGTCVLVASQAGNSSFLPASDVTQSFTITGLAQSITFAQPSALTTVSEDQALSASSTSGLAVSFRTSTPSICTIQGSALAPVTSGSCVVVASQAGDGTYSPAEEVSRTVAITFVAKSPQRITFAPVSAMVLEDAAQQLAFTTITNTPVQLSAGPSNICTLDAQRKISAIGEGVCNIRAFQPATRQLAESEAKVSLTVFRRASIAERTVGLDWPRPGSIDARTPLSQEQLNARATVPGKFVYSPGLGALLPRGINDLTVTFTPDDVANYVPVTMSVKILVRRADSPSPTPSASPLPTISPTPKSSSGEPIFSLSTTIYFKNGSANVDEVGRRILKKQVVVLRDAKVFKIYVNGYASSLPGVDNLSLSKRRAEAVAEILKTLEPRLKIFVKFFGSTSPVASEKTKQGQAKNRRVVITTSPNS